MGSIGWLMWISKIEPIFSLAKESFHQKLASDILGQKLSRVAASESNSESRQEF